MIEELEQVLDKLKDLPEERQAFAAEVLARIAAGNRSRLKIPDDHRAAVLEGLVSRLAAANSPPTRPWMTFCAVPGHEGPADR
jgi:hypothetical protein